MSRFTARECVEPSSVGLCHGRHVFGLLLATFNFQAPDAQLRDRLKMIVGREILGRDQIAAVERLAGRVVIQRVVLAAGLCA